MTATIIYSLCALTALLCTFMLIAAHRRRFSRLLLWSGIAFAGLTLNNLLLVLDKLIFLEIDLLPLRGIVALLAMVVLLYGLVWEAE